VEYIAVTVAIVALCLTIIVLARRDGPPRTNSPIQGNLPPPPLLPPVIVIRVPAGDTGNRPVEVSVVPSMTNASHLLADEQERAA